MNEKRLTKPVVYAPLAALCCLLWSSAFPFIKLGYRYFQIAAEDAASQILFAGYRFALAGIITLAFTAAITRKSPFVKRKQTVWHIAVLAAVQTVITYVCFYLALARIDGSAGSVINSAGTFLSVLLAAIVFQNDRLNAFKMAGCILGLGGIVFLHVSSLRFSGSFAGEGLMLLSAISYAASSVLIKLFSRFDSPALLSGWQFLAGGLCMVFLGKACGGTLGQGTAAGMGILVYLAFVSACAYTLWGILLKYNPVSKIAVFGFLNPVGGVLLSALVLGEHISPLSGSVCLCAVSLGIVLVNSVGQSKTNAA